MADVTQRVVVKVDYEGNLKSGIDEVKQLGKVADDDVKAFQSLQKEINQGINDALQEAGVSMKDFADASKKATDPSQFKSLKQQIREAKDEATALAAKFGDTSKQAIDAQKKVAKLSDQLGDFNDRVKALNPDAKFNAVNQTLQGTIGAFQGITGAAQLFGAENKSLNETLMKMQGLLNLTQGVNSVMQLKDAFTNLRVVLGITAVAEEGVAAGAGTMSAALSATGIGAIIVGIGLLAGAMWELNKAEEEAAKSAEDLNKKLAESTKSYGDQVNKTAKDVVRQLEYQLNILQAQGASEKDILQKQQQIQQYRKDGIEKLIAFYGLTEDYNVALQDTQNKLDVIAAKLDVLYQKSLRTNIGKMVEIEAKNAEIVANARVEAELAASDKIDNYEQHRKEFLAQENKRRFEKFVQDMNRYFDLAAPIANQIAVMFKQQTDDQYNYEEVALNEQLKRKEISQKQYDAKLRAMKRRQAEDDKKYALFTALLQSANAIINAAASLPFDPTKVAFVSALSALQIAAISSRPIPKFAKGSLFVNGGSGGVDDIPAYLNRGEAVIPTHLNKAYAPAVDAIYHSKIHPSVLNAFVHAHKTGKTSNSMIANMELMRAVKGNGTVNVRNASDLAKMIGAEVANNLNYRRR